MPDETIKVAELKATMLDNLIDTYLDVDDNEVMIELLLNQMSDYIGLLYPPRTQREAGENNGNKEDS